MIIAVTAAVIENGGKILIAQRRPGKSNGLKWEFPGGKLEEGESPEECLKREMKEEMDVEVAVGGIYNVSVSHYREQERTILLLAYKCTITSGELKTIDCNDFRWAAYGELKDYDFTEADLPVVEKLINS